MFRLKRVAVLAAAMLAAGTAQAIDLTTYGHSTEQARVARYTVEMGISHGDTSGEFGDDPFYHGAYDYVSYRSGAAWGQMNDGVLDSFCHTWQSTAEEDFFGYRFKRPATVTELNWSNLIFDNGGTFVETPRVEVLAGAPMEKGGTWQPVAVNWDVPYDTSYIPAWGTRPYVITPAAPTGEVWGVRLIGTPSGTSPEDPTGHIGCGEFQVSGVSSMTRTVDLSTNLALNQTPLWPHTDFTGQPSTEFGTPQILTDGDYSYVNYDTTYDEIQPAAKDFVGVMFDTPQSNVAAVGVTMLFCDVSYSEDKNLKGYTGGWIAANDLTVEYTVDDGATWTAVTGLDVGRLPDMETELEAIKWTYCHSELLTFDKITQAIDGIRMAGPPVVRNSNDPDGFIATMEFEAFAAAADLPPVPGDANGDRYVDAADATILAQHWGMYDPATITWDSGDFDGDFRVGPSDASILAANWNPAPGESSAVPEPGTMAALLGFGLLVLSRRTRRY